jgi:hypothetical protein
MKRLFITGLWFFLIYGQFGAVGDIGATRLDMDFMRGFTGDFIAIVYAWFCESKAGKSRQRLCVQP